MIEGRRDGQRQREGQLLIEESSQHPQNEDMAFMTVDGCL